MNVFNLNDSVWVQLTDTGRAHLRTLRDKRSETAEGWSKWIGWDLMHTFGSLMVMGGEPPFNMNVRMETSEPPPVAVKTFTFTTKDQKVTVLASMITGMRRLNDASYGPRTAIDTSDRAIYLVIETDEEYEARVAAWQQFLTA